VRLKLSVRSADASSACWERHQIRADEASALLTISRRSLEKENSGKISFPEFVHCSDCAQISVHSFGLQTAGSGAFFRQSSVAFFQSRPCAASAIVRNAVV